MRKHFVQFFSPGTFIAEMTEKPIDSWDVEKAKLMAAEIVERYNDCPYAFQFTTRERKDEDLDSKKEWRSPYYFLNCKVETLEEIKERNDPKERILLSNMEGNGFKAVARTKSGWLWTQPIREGDVVLA